jgi:phosphatidate cytidylyltransferase
MQLWLPAALFMVLAAVRLFDERNPAGSRAELAQLVMGVVYVPGLLIPQWLLRLEAVEWIYFLYLCVWSSDSAAYYLGKHFGRHKLYVTVSPKKTVEGAVGSIIGGGLAAVISGWWFFQSQGLLFLVFAGVLIGAVSIVGDLVESMLKRDADIKDSGGLLPGHGGVLDRLDSVLFAGPVLYMLVQAVS